MRANVQRRLVIAIAASNSLLVASAWGGPNVDVGIGLEHHSNAARVSDNEESDVARTAHAALTWVDLLSPIETNVGYRVERTEYQDETDEDETAVDGQAALRWHAVPRRLDVILQHQISQTQTDLRTADTADNRERRSILTGGVDGFLQLSTVDAIVISPRYTDASYEESSQSDSKRTNVDLSWRRALNAVSTLSVSTGVGRVRFDESEQDYDSSLIQVGYQTALSRLNYSLSVGATQFDRKELDDVNGHTVRAGLDFKGEGFNVGGTLVSELTDSSVGLSSNEFTFTHFESNDSNFDQPDVLERSQLDLYWRQDLSASSSLDLRIGASRDDYETLLLDQDSVQGSVGYRYVVNTYWDWNAEARYEKVDFTDDPLNREHKDSTLILSTRYRFTSDLDVQLSVSREKRDSNLQADDYTDNIAMVRINYRLL
jgi:hypothetical protein